MNNFIEVITIDGFMRIDVEDIMAFSPLVDGCVIYTRSKGEVYTHNRYGKDAVFENDAIYEKLKSIQTLMAKPKVMN